MKGLSEDEQLIRKHKIKVCKNIKKSGKLDLNQRPSAWKADALTPELFPLVFSCFVLHTKADDE